MKFWASASVFTFFHWARSARVRKYASGVRSQFLYFRESPSAKTAEAEAMTARTRMAGRVMGLLPGSEAVLAPGALGRAREGRLRRALPNQSVGGMHARGEENRRKNGHPVCGAYRSP